MEQSGLMRGVAEGGACGEGPSSPGPPQKALPPTANSTPVCDRRRRSRKGDGLRLRRWKPDLSWERASVPIACHVISVQLPEGNKGRRHEKETREIIKSGDSPASGRRSGACFVPLGSGRGHPLEPTTMLGYTFRSFGPLFRAAGSMPVGLQWQGQWGVGSMAPAGSIFGLHLDANRHMVAYGRSAEPATHSLGRAKK